MKSIFTICSLLLFAFCTSAGEGTKKSIYDFTMKDIDGHMVSLSEYKGKVILIVNVASKCGFTPQYKELEELYQKYKSKGLVILGFPANNFMSQEPGDDQTIKSFCTSTYNVSFPMFSKISVRGADMHPLYKFLTKKSENGTVDSSVKWNFQKFLISKSGKEIDYFLSPTKVTEPKVIEAIEKALNE